jgi:hypothetical protein
MSKELQAYGVDTQFAFGVHTLSISHTTTFNTAIISLQRFAKLSFHLVAGTITQGMHDPSLSCDCETDSREE